MNLVSLTGRQYGYHLPNGVNPSAPAPVVLILHALGIDAKMMEHATGFSDLADKEGFIAVYPEGTEQPNNKRVPGFPDKLQMWNSGGLFDVKGVDDVAFLKEVLRDISSKTNINPKKVYVVGMSNGAMMAYRLAAESSQAFTAMAAVAGTITSGPWNPTVPRMPVLHIHGTDDRIVTETAADWHPSLEDVMKTCAAYNKCSTTPSKGPPLPSGDKYPVEKWYYAVGAPGAEVILYRVLGGGHTWPQQQKISGLPAALVPISTSINATRTIWDFLSAY